MSFKFELYDNGICVPSYENFWLRNNFEYTQKYEYGPETWKEFINISLNNTGIFYHTGLVKDYILFETEEDMINFILKWS